jgi:hypothetical protein
MIAAHQRVVQTTERIGEARVRPAVLFFGCDMLLLTR